MQRPGAVGCSRGCLRWQVLVCCPCIPCLLPVYPLFVSRVSLVCCLCISYSLLVYPLLLTFCVYPCTSVHLSSCIVTVQHTHTFPTGCQQILTTIPACMFTWAVDCCVENAGISVCSSETVACEIASCFNSEGLYVYHNVNTRCGIVVYMIVLDSLEHIDPVDRFHVSYDCIGSTDWLTWLNQWIESSGWHNSIPIGNCVRWFLCMMCVWVALCATWLHESLNIINIKSCLYVRVCFYNAKWICSKYL